MQVNEEKTGDAKLDVEMPLLESSNDLATRKWHTIPAEQVCKELATDMTQGLNEDNVEALRTKYGTNELPPPPRPSLIWMFLKQFIDFMVVLLLIVGIVELVLKEWIEGGVLVAVVMINTIVGFEQERRAQKALDALNKLSVPRAVVIRDGEQDDIPSAELVPGDLVVLEEGDSVPADLRLTMESGMFIDEATLTGESHPVEKNVDSCPESEYATPLGDQHNMAFMSSVVMRGRGLGVVVRVGSHTEVGKISASLAKRSDKEPPLKKKLHKLAVILVGVSVLLCGCVIGIGLIRVRVNYKGVSASQVEKWIKIGVALAVAVVPEGLVAVVTMTMAIGVQRMARRNALVRNLSAVETLGSVTTICSDKTGTLTEGKMRAVEIWVPATPTPETAEAEMQLVRGEFPGSYRCTIGGTGLAPVGEISSTFSIGDKVVEEKPAVGKGDEVPDALRLLGMACALCNNSALKQDFEDDPNGVWEATGDPTEVALEVAARKIDLGKDEWLDSYHFRLEIPFDSDRKCMTVVYGGGMLPPNHARQGSAGQFEVLASPTVHLGRTPSEKRLEEPSMINHNSPKSKSTRSMHNLQHMGSAGPAGSSGGLLGEGEDPMRRSTTFHKKHARQRRPQLMRKKWLTGKFKAVHEGSLKEDGVVLVKGALDTVLAKCAYSISVVEHDCALSMPLNDAQRAQINRENEVLAAQGLRTLAFAYKPVGADKLSSLSEDRPNEVECDLVFLGLVGIRDPPKATVRPAIARAHGAGINVVMITGDNPITALSIGLDLGMLPESTRNLTPEERKRYVMTGNDLDNTTDAQLEKVSPFPSIFARVTPAHKLRIVQALRARGQITAMTGDGVNDAPAIKNANVGIAMGLTGTDLTKQVADITLLDDDFSTITNAVEEGRATFDNIQKFVLYLLACNSSEIYVVLTAVIAGLPPPFTPIMILWANLVVDVPPAMALGIDTKNPDVMDRLPRDPQAKIFGWRALCILVCQGLIIAGLSLGSYCISMFVMDNKAELDLIESLGEHGPKHPSRARTLCFVSLAVMHIMQSFLSKSIKDTAFNKTVFQNMYLVYAILFSLIVIIIACYIPGLNKELDLVPLNGWEWLVIIICLVLQVILSEASKAMLRVLHGKKPPVIADGRPLFYSDV